MQFLRSLYVLSAGFVLALAPNLSAASYRTQNFYCTDAPTQAVAEQFCKAAEQYRKQKAMDWLGQEMPPWPKPCPLHVKAQMQGAGGATQFNYDFHGGYEVMQMEINGEMERMLHSVLPHEVTHTVFAHYFRYPVPRWADEGGSVLSEDDRERSQHDRMCRDFLNARQGIPLRRLFQIKEYQETSNVMILYAQGFSITNYLVNLGGRQAWLGFVATGMRGDWDKAVQTYYHMDNVEALEAAWLKNLRDTKNGAAATLAQNPAPGRPAGDLTGRVVTRQTVPPAFPQLDPAGPVARGVADDTSMRPDGRPVYLPEAPPPTVPPLRVPPPAAPPPPAVPPVLLGNPEFGPRK